MRDGLQQSDDLEFWLALNRVAGLGPGRAKCLLEHFGGPRPIFDASESALIAQNVSPVARQSLQSPPWSGVEGDRSWLEGAGHHVVTLADPRYPQRLAEIADPPPVLFVSGSLGILAQPQLAIVGSRNPTAAGRDIAGSFSRAFASTGLVVTSGLALGIDAAAHRGALDGGGHTIAVMGSGAGLVYPHQHRTLAREAAAHGAVVTEFGVGTPPRAQNFPRRNRVISGLSLGVLVVEAARKSGSLTTARCALEQGREVFAIPGSIHNPLAKGCHSLIRAGAKLVETVEDVLEEIAHQCEVQPTTAPENTWNFDIASGGNPIGLDEDYALLLDSMAYDRVTVDTLVGRTGLTAEVVSSMLLILELKGLVAPEPGGFYSRTARPPQR